MPIYDYECRSCGAHFTKKMSMREQDTDRPHCPQCASEDAEQLIEAVYVATSKKS